jgi:hypothetical protein
MSDLLFEWMIRAETATHVCRIWREMSWPQQPTNKELKAEAVKMLSIVTLKDIVEHLVLVDGVNSVEIIDRSTGDGICVHKDWP